MTVTGASMRPTYEIGDVLVVQKPTGDELTRIGTPVVVSFAAGDRSDQYVHRVHEITADGVILKGDGNTVNDPFPVVQNQVLGTPRFALQGDVALAFRASELWSVRLTVGAIFLIALFMPTSLRDRRAARHVRAQGAPVSLPRDTSESETARVEPAALLNEIEREFVTGSTPQ